MPRCRPFLLLAATAVAACGESPTGPGGPASLSFITTEASGTPGWLLDDSLEVRLISTNGNPMPGVEVEWSTTAAGGFFSQRSTSTDDRGIARVEFAPGWARGTQTVTATVGSRTASLDVQVTSMEFIATEVLDRRVCGLDTDGRMWCWPEYSPTYSHATIHPMRLHPDVRPIPVATSLSFTVLRSYTNPWGSDPGSICVITAGGELWCATRTDFDGPQLTASSVPTLHRVQTPVPVTDWAGGGHFGDNECILDTSGFAWCRGLNQYGQLGDGTTTNSDAWRPVQGGLRFAEITVGDRDACAIALNGRPYCWGGNSNSRLGITPAAFSVPVPTPVDGDMRLQRITNASSGLCGIAAFGTPELLCWGPTFPARRINASTPSGIQGIPTTATSLGGDTFGGRITHDGRLYRFGYNGGWVADFEFYSDQLEPDLTGIDRLVSLTSYYWCVRHESGSTICSTVRSRPVGVPLPE